jgi:hypothetical protein
MSVRAKFKVDSIERTRSSAAKRDEAGAPVKDERGNYVYVPIEMQTVKLSPVYANGDPNHENSKFWAATPSGSITLGTVNADAVRPFDLGKEFYIDFTEAT